MLKIFHCADLHLDSPFAGLEPKKSEASRRRLRELFCRMMKYVAENDYDLVLIAGDLYESGYLTEETRYIIANELANVGCPVVISPGNHDPYDAGSLYRSTKLPENVHVFGSEELSFKELPKIGACVYGYAFTTPSLKANAVVNKCVRDADAINILCAHTEIANPLSVYAPTTYADIDAAGFTYAALGHVHNPPEPNYSACVSAYSGFGEGRGFDEIGAGGALSVRIFDTGDSKKVEIERLIFSSHSYETRKLDISDSADDSEIMSKLRALISAAGYGSQTALRVTLTGVTAPSSSPNTAFLERNCKGELDILEVKDDTLPLLDADKLESDPTLRGEIYRSLKSIIISGSEEERSDAASALRIALAAIEDRDISSFMPPEEVGTGSAENTESYEVDGEI